MSQNDSSTSPEQERQRLERICAVLVEAFEAHPETRDADRCAIKLDNQRGIVIDDDDPRELWTAKRVAAHYAVAVRVIYAARRRSRGDPPRGWTTTMLEVRPGGGARAVGERARAAAPGAYAAPPSDNEAACSAA